MSHPEFNSAQFNRLIGELVRGVIVRNEFASWEVHLLLDIEGCRLQPSVKKRLLARYQRAMLQRFTMSGRPPVPFSEYLELGRNKAISAA